MTSCKVHPEEVQFAMPDSASCATAATTPSNRSRDPDARYPLVLYKSWGKLTSTYDHEDVPTSDAPRLLRDLGENRSNGTQGHVGHDQERDWYISLHCLHDRQAVIVGWLNKGNWHSISEDFMLEPSRLSSNEAACIKGISEMISDLVGQQQTVQEAYRCIDHQDTEQTRANKGFAEMHSGIQTAIKSSSEAIVKMLIEHVETIKPTTDVSVER